MRISDVVKQIALVLPRYTDLFADVQSVESIVASGGIATVTTTERHNLNDGAAVTIVGVETRTPIASFERTGLNYVFTTSEDHDLTFGWPEHENIQLGGFTDSEFNSSFKLKASDTRNSFKIMGSGANPVLNGNEYLLEPERVDGVNGIFGVTVTGLNTFTISGDFSDGIYTPINGKVFSNPRVSGTIDIDRSLDQYTKQNVSDFWAFVEPVDANVSKDRSAYSDATATITSGQEMRTRIVDGFIVYIYAPTSDDIAGMDALDICRHDLMLPMMRTLYGANFDTGLSCENGDFRTILNGHGVAAYKKAFMVYRYEFEVVIDLTDSDTVLPANTRAFRNVDYNLSIQDVT